MYLALAVCSRLYVGIPSFSRVNHFAAGKHIDFIYNLLKRDRFIGFKLGKLT